MIISPSTLLETPIPDPLQIKCFCCNSSLASTKAIRDLSNKFVPYSVIKHCVDADSKPERDRFYIKSLEYCSRCFGKTFGNSFLASNKPVITTVLFNCFFCNKQMNMFDDTYYQFDLNFESRFAFCESCFFEAAGEEYLKNFDPL